MRNEPKYFCIVTDTKHRRQSNPDITNFMRKWNISGDYHRLESIYIQKLLDIVSSFPTKNGYIVWQEVFDNGVQVKNDTIIHVWKGQWEWELSKVTSKGLRAIVSSPWYLNYISYGSDWTKYYLAEPLDFYGCLLYTSDAADE